MARMLKYYPALGYDRIWSKFPMSKGYALIAAAMSMDGWLQFSGVEIADGGYVRGEVQNLMKKKK
jgi:hypothetical protein